MKQAIIKNNLPTDIEVLHRKKKTHVYKAYGQERIDGKSKDKSQKIGYIYVW